MAADDAVVFVFATTTTTTTAAAAAICCCRDQLLKDRSTGDADAGVHSTKRYAFLDIPDAYPFR